MKKITSLILALVMALSLTTAAFATETTITGATKNTEGKYTNNGTVTITTGGTAGETTGAVGDSWKITVPASKTEVTVPTDYKTVTANYYVVVKWEVESSIVYKVGGEGYSWVVTDKDSEGRALEQAAINGAYVAGGNTWEGTASVKVTVTNLSNRQMTAKATFAPATGVTVTAADAADVVLDSASKNVTTTDAVTFENAPSGTTTVNINKPTAGSISADGDAIGYVTVTVTPEAEA